MTEVTPVQEDNTITTEVTSATIEERVARLRADLQSSPQGRKIMMELFPSETAQNGPPIVDFTDWSEWSKHW